MSQIVDSYSKANVSLWYKVYSGGDDHAKGQTFAGNGKVLSFVKLLLYKVGSPTGNIYAKIYATSGTYGTSSCPTGSPLATSDAFDISTIDVTSSANAKLFTFNFSKGNRIILNNGTKYALVLFNDNGNSSNCVYFGLDYITKSHGGNYFYSFLTGDWVPDNTKDVCFYVFGEPILSPFPNNFKLQ